MFGLQRQLLLQPLLRPTPRWRQRAGHAARRHTRRAGPVRRRARCRPRPRFQVSSQINHTKSGLFEAVHGASKDTEKSLWSIPVPRRSPSPSFLYSWRALFVWLSLTMAAAEGAVARVTRASLNNLILEVQTDSEASQFLEDEEARQDSSRATAHRRPLRHRRQLCVLPHRLQCARRRTGVFHRIPVGCRNCGLNCSPDSCSPAIVAVVSGPWSARAPPAWPSRSAPHDFQLAHRVVGHQAHAVRTHRRRQVRFRGTGPPLQGLRSVRRRGA